MKKIIKLSIMFIVLSIKSNGQANLSKLQFKNSIMYQDEKKVYSYKPNGEIILFDTRSEKNEIETKIIVTTLNGNLLKLDTLNIDSLNKSVREIIQGIGQYKKWILKSSSAFHKNGKIKTNILYSNVGKTGLYSSYDNTGRPIEKGYYINNMAKDGEWLKYDEMGKIARKENYVDGFCIEKRHYYPNGKIMQVETTINDKYTRTVYSENEKIQLKKEIKNGRGEEIEYYENGNIKNTIFFENGIDITEQKQRRVQEIGDSIAYIAHNNEQNFNASNEEVYTVVEEMPEFIGGQEGEMLFIQRNLQYPQSAKNARIMGTCYVRFIVTSNGTLKDIQLLKGISSCKECGDEAIRVIKSMPNWKPGKQNGKAVSVSMNQAVKFQ